MAKQVIEVIGMCSSAKYARMLVDSVGTTMRAQVYWNLFNPEGTMIAENKQSTCTYDYGHPITMGDSVEFVTIKVLQHLNDQHVEFTGDPIS